MTTDSYEEARAVPTPGLSGEKKREQALRLLERGVTVERCAGLVGLTPLEVRDLVSGHESSVPETTQAIPERKPLPATVRPIRSSVSEEPDPADRSTEALFRRAEQASPALGKRVAKMREAIVAMWVVVDEYEARTSEREEALAAVERAKKALAEAIEKAKDAGASVTVRHTASGTRTNNISDEGRAKMRANALRTQHKKGNHESKPKDGCDLCGSAP